MSVTRSSATFSQSVCCQHEDLLGTALVNSESKAEKASQTGSISGDFILDFLSLGLKWLLFRKTGSKLVHSLFYESRIHR